MNEIFTKLFDHFSVIARPWPLLLATFLVSGLLISDLGGFASRFELTEDVKEWKLALFLAFSTTGLIVLFRLLIVIASFAQRVLSSVRYAISYRLIPLNVQESVVLDILKEFQPESTQLLLGHPIVRQLRKKGLIEMYGQVYVASEYRRFRLTHAGEKVLGRLQLDDFRNLPERDQVEFLRSVTGMELTKHQPPPWAT